MYGAFTYGNWTWNAGTKVLTIIANATNNEGNTEANAYSFQDIVNSGLVAGFYNRSYCGTQFEFDFRIILGNGVTTTWFVDTEKQIKFRSTACGANQMLIRIQGEGHFKIGVLDDADDKTTSRGCSIVSKVTSSHYIFYSSYNTDYLEILSSHISAKDCTVYPSIQLSPSSKLYNSILNDVALRDTKAGCDVYNVFISNAPYYGLQSTQGTYDRLTIMECGVAGAQLYGTIPFQVSNVLARNNAFLLYIGYLTVNAYLIDWNADAWTLNFYAGTSTAEIYRQYTFKINITDTNGVPIQSANVTMIDAEGTQEFTVLTGANGSFAEQIISYGYYNQTGGNTPYLLTPHVLTVTHENYTTLNHTVTINEWKTVTQVVLYNKAFSVGVGAGLILGVPIGVLLIGLIVVKKKRG